MFCGVLQRAGSNTHLKLIWALKLLRPHIHQEVIKVMKKVHYSDNKNLRGEQDGLPSKS